jgi:hypothetical protein
MLQLQETIETERLVVVVTTRLVGLGGSYAAPGYQDPVLGRGPISPSPLKN